MNNLRVRNAFVKSCEEQTYAVRDLVFGGEISLFGVWA